MKTTIRLIAILALAASLTILAVAQSSQHADHQQHKQTQAGKSDHDAHHDGVNKRGDQAMGFSHAKTTHHFRLKKSGGIIEVTANDSTDTTSRDQIRTHLKHIAGKFAQGDFTAPMFIHSQTPAGVPAMKRLKAEIKYEFAEIEGGAQVRISTSNADAIKSIHEFLRFQINDHKTGDSLEINQ